MKGETSIAVSDGNWVFLKPLTIGKHTIAFGDGFSNGSKEHNNVTNSSISFGLPIGWDCETRLGLLVLTSDSYIDNKNFSYSRRGSISTSISIGEILEHNLIHMYAYTTNKYQVVKNDTIIDYLTKSNGRKTLADTTGETQILQKDFSYESFPESVKFYIDLVNRLKC